MTDPRIHIPMPLLISDARSAASDADPATSHGLASCSEWTGVPVKLLLADDFVMTVAEGTLYNKAQMVASVADKSYRPLALQSSDMSVHYYGNTAILTGAYYEKGIDKGKAWERRGRFTDTWVNLNGSWQCVVSQSTLIAR